jgi:tryptophanyl-tRNA synthetase
MRQIKRVLSGITPSGGNLHLGNYFGAVKPHIMLQETVEEAFYFIADLHALTTVHDKKQLEYNISNVILDYLALGLDPDRAVFFRQSMVPAHTQLAIVLANFISYGQMQRMHAFKDKLQAGTDVGSINMGLFNYPILMAADILIYKPDGVPVGEDQRQHVELTRDIALSFNKAYNKEIFPLPEAIIGKDQFGRLVGTDGARKMSKSLNNVVGIMDSQDVINKQIMKCYTDPDRIKATDPGKIEGNTVFVYHDLINQNKQEVDELKQRYLQGTVGDVEVKQKLILAHEELFAQSRERRQKLVQDKDLVNDILQTGASKAKLIADKTLEEVYENIGI